MKIIKSSTRGGGDANDNAYSRSMYRREVCVGTVGPNAIVGSTPLKVSAPTNSIPLDARVQHSSLRSTVKYDWQTGGTTFVPRSIVDNAHENINTMKIRTVTSGRNERHDDQMNVYGIPAMPNAVRRVNKRKKKGTR